MADLILIPTTSSTIDLDQAVKFRRRISGEKIFFVLNMVNRRTKSYSAAKLALQKVGRLCPIDVPFRESIAFNVSLGLTASDVGAPGSEWFDALWDFVRLELDLGAPAEVAA
jgi:hypothetical protein